jgi:hypothetical protein
MKKFIASISIALAATAALAQFTITTNTPAPQHVVKDIVLTPEQLDAIGATLGATNINSAVLVSLRVQRTFTKSNDVFIVKTTIK